MRVPSLARYWKKRFRKDPQEGDIGATVLGRIDCAMSKDILEWAGELYAIECVGDVLFCLSRGVVMV